MTFHHLWLTCNHLELIIVRLYLSLQYQCNFHQQQCFSGLLSQKKYNLTNCYILFALVVVCGPRGRKHTWNYWAKIRQGSQNIGSELQSAKVTTNL